MSHELIRCLEAVSIEEKFLESIYPWKYSKSCIFSLLFANKITSSANYTKQWITRKWTKYQNIHNDILYHLAILIICIIKHFHFRWPLKRNIPTIFKEVIRWDIRKILFGHHRKLPLHCQTFHVTSYNLHTKSITHHPSPRRIWYFNCFVPLDWTSRQLH